MSGLADAAFPLRHNLGEEAIFSMMHIPSSTPPNKKAGAREMSGERSVYPTPEHTYAESAHQTSSHAASLRAASQQVPQPLPPNYYPPFYPPSYPGAAPNSFTPLGVPSHYYPPHTPGTESSIPASAIPAAPASPSLSPAMLSAVVRSALRDMLHTEGWAKSETSFAEPRGNSSSAARIGNTETLLAGQGLLATPAAQPATAADSSSMFLWAMVLLAFAVLTLVTALVVAWRVSRSSARRRRALPEDALNEVASTLMALRPDRLAARVWVKQILGEIRRRQGAGKRRGLSRSAARKGGMVGV